MNRVLALAGTLGLVALTACSSPNLDEVDLASIARFGEVRRERRVVPLADKGATEFSSGWSWPERDAQDRSFRWAVDESSELSFFCVEPRDLTLELSVRPFVWKGALEQGLRCRLNGLDLGRQDLRSAIELKFDLPSNAVLAGENTVELVWDRATKVSDVHPSKDRRRLAAAVSSVVFEGLGGCSAESGLGLEEGIVVISPGEEIRIAVMAGARSTLSYRSSNGSTTNLQIWTRRDDTPFAKVCGPCAPSDDLDLGSLEGPLQIALRAGGETPVQLAEATLRWRMSATVPTAVEQEIRPRPDIVLYVVDTLRADRLSAYGGPPGISPALDELATDGVLFERAIAQSSWTKPSMVSLLSGLLTTEHGVRTREPVIPPQVELIAELFREAGYRTGAFTTNAYLTPSAGFDRGFDTFEYAQLNAREVTLRALEWLDDDGDERPVFLWVHTVDPHAPYRAARAFRQAWAPHVGEKVGTFEHVRSLGGRPSEETAPFVPQYLALYDAEVAQNDAAFGRLLEHLKKSKRYEDACIVFVSDHGEEFWEHGVNGHGWDLFEEVLHVPLVVKPPRWDSGGLRVAQGVQHIDLAPSLLRIAGLSPSEAMSGHNLFDFGSDDHRAVFSEMTYEGREGFSARHGSYKFIQPLSRNFLPTGALFDLDLDPGEMRNVADEHPVTAAWLAQEGRRMMSRLENAPQAGEPATLNDEQRRGLEALGYLDPDGER